jgi:hypothetical protein
MLRRIKSDESGKNSIIEKSGAWIDQYEIGDSMF